MSRLTRLATYMFRTLTIRIVRVTRKSKISRLTRLRVCALSEALTGTSCASSVEILDVSHKAPCHLHVPNPYGTEFDLIWFICPWTAIHITETKYRSTEERNLQGTRRFTC